MNAEIKKIKVEIPGPDGSKLTDEKTVMFIPCAKVSGDVALRVYDREKDSKGNIIKNETVMFKSTRSGQVISVDGGYQVDLSELSKVDGKEFELMEISSKNIIASGVIGTTPNSTTVTNAASEEKKSGKK
jgi:hypothetical protein